MKNKLTNYPELEKVLNCALMRRFDELDAAVQGVYAELAKEEPRPDEKQWREINLERIRLFLEERPLESSSVAHLSLLELLLTYWRALEDTAGTILDPSRVG